VNPLFIWFIRMGLPESPRGPISPVICKSCSSIADYFRPLAEGHVPVQSFK
jgi:hypothetical protein